MKKFLIWMATLMILVGGLVWPTYAATSPYDERWPEQEYLEENYVGQPWFSFGEINAKSNSIEFRFDGTGGGKMRYALWEVRFAGYDYENVTLEEADARIAELRGDSKPDWAKWWNKLAPQMETGRVLSQSVLYGKRGTPLQSGPGILHYAVLIRDNLQGTDNAEYFWVYGKIDYRKCAYGSSGEPHLTRSCVMSGTQEEGSYYEYVSADGAGIAEDYMSWGEEWGETLRKSLEDLEKEMADWSGDETEEVKYRADLARIRYLAADADEKSGVLEEVARLEDWLNERKTKIEEEQKRQEEEEQKRLEDERRQEEEEQKRLEEEKRREEEQKRQETLNRPVVSGATVSASVVGGSEVDGDSGLGGVNDDAVVATRPVVMEDNAVAMTDSVVNSSTAVTARTTQAVTENTEVVGQTDERNETTENETSVLTAFDTKENVNVPGLYDAKVTWKWILWPILASILAVMGVVLYKIRRRLNQNR